MARNTLQIKFFRQLAAVRLPLRQLQGRRDERRPYVSLFRPFRPWWRTGYLRDSDRQKHQQDVDNDRADSGAKPTFRLAVCLPMKNKIRPSSFLQLVLLDWRFHWESNVKTTRSAPRLPHALRAYRQQPSGALQFYQGSSTIRPGPSPPLPHRPKDAPAYAHNRQRRPPPI